MSVQTYFAGLQKEQNFSKSQVICLKTKKFEIFKILVLIRKW